MISERVMTAENLFSKVYFVLFRMLLGLEIQPHCLRTQEQRTEQNKQQPETNEETCIYMHNNTKHNQQIAVF